MQSKQSKKNSPYQRKPAKALSTDNPTSEEEQVIDEALSGFCRVKEFNFSESEESNCGRSVSSKKNEQYLGGSANCDFLKDFEPLPEGQPSCQNSVLHIPTETGTALSLPGLEGLDLSASRQQTSDAKSSTSKLELKRPRLLPARMRRGILPRYLNDTRSLLMRLYKCGRVRLPANRTFRDYWRNILSAFYQPLMDAPLGQEFVMLETRKPDQYELRTLSQIKKQLYGPLKKQRTPGRVQGKTQPISKQAALQILQERYNISDKEMLQRWFGSYLKNGLQENMKDLIFKPEGKLLFEHITDLQFVQGLVSSLHAKTKDNITNNLLNKLQNPITAKNFLQAKTRTTKLPWSYVGNLLSCLAFYRAIQMRGETYSLAFCQEEARAQYQKRLQDIIEWLQTKIRESPAGRKSLTENPQATYVQIEWA